MNKKGFTLVELIVVITLIAIVAVIATPNVIKMVENGRKEQILADAQNFLTDVKYKSKLGKYETSYPTTGGCKNICASENLFAPDLDKDPDNNPYDRNESCVKVCKNETTGGYSYSIKLASKNSSGQYIRGISASDTEITYVKENELSRNKVVKFKIG